jgi:uncharacterized membrane protein
MCRVPAVHRVAVVVGVEMFFFVSVAGFLPVAATIVVPSFLLGQS